jgi:hypothetical protein
MFRVGCFSSGCTVVLRGRLSPTLGLLLLLLPVPGRAEGRIEITPCAGFLFGGGFQSSASGDDLTVGEAPGFGLILGLRETPRTHYELLYRFQRTDLERAEGSSGAPRTDLDIHYLHLGSTYEFPRETVLPFISAGLGLTSFVPSGQDSSTNFSISLGGGMKIPLTERVGLRLEGRGYLTILPDSTEIFCVVSSGGACSAGVQGDTLVQFEVLAGIVFEL